MRPTEDPCRGMAQAYFHRSGALRPRRPAARHRKLEVRSSDPRSLPGRCFRRQLKHDRWHAVQVSAPGSAIFLGRCCGRISCTPWTRSSIYCADVLFLLPIGALRRQLAVSLSARCMRRGGVAWCGGGWGPCVHAGECGVASGEWDVEATFPSSPFSSRRLNNNSSNVNSKSSTFLEFRIWLSSKVPNSKSKLSITQTVRERIWLSSEILNSIC